MCCTVTEVPELQKPQGQTCQHCQADCTIYDERPESCRSFACAWLAGEMPDWMRPDRVDAMVERLPDVPVVIVLPKPGRETTWRTTQVVDVLKQQYQGKGVAVVASDRMVLVPDGQTVQGVMGDVYAAARSMGMLA
jgi:hypothetical protein